MTLQRVCTDEPSWRTEPMVLTGHAWRDYLTPGSQSAPWWGAAATVAFVCPMNFRVAAGRAIAEASAMRFVLARTDGVMTVTERLP